MYEQRATQLVRAPRAQVYAALLDANAVATWRTPDDMVARVAEWEPVEGGRFRVSLTYRGEERVGKTEGATDSYSGRFERLVPDESVVEVLEFDSPDATFAGEMTLTTTLRDVDGGTEVELHHEGVPDAVAPEDNEAGTRSSLGKLAAYLEGAE